MGRAPPRRLHTVGQLEDVSRTFGPKRPSWHPPHPHPHPTHSIQQTQNHLLSTPPPTPHRPAAVPAPPPCLPCGLPSIPLLKSHKISSTSRPAAPSIYHHPRPHPQWSFFPARAATRRSRSPRWRTICGGRLAPTTPSRAWTAPKSSPATATRPTPLASRRQKSTKRPCTRAPKPARAGKRNATRRPNGWR